MSQRTTFGGKPQLSTTLKNAPLLAALAAIGMAPYATVFAQALPNAGSTLETQRPTPEPARRAPDLRVPEPSRPAMKAEPTLRVQVKNFRVTGNTVISEAELQGQLRNFVGKELDFAGLNQAAAAITAYYRSRGYVVAQAYLPEQDIKSGTVQIAVLEGRLGSVKLDMAPGARLREASAAGVMRGVQPGNAIAVDNVERNLLLLNDLSGVRATGALQPGANVGESDLVVRVEDDGPMVRGSVELDNYGSRYTGDWRLGGSVRVVNPSGRGDQLGLRALRSDNGGLTIGSVGYSLPVGDNGLRASLSYTSLNYKVKEEFAALGANGDAEVWAAALAYPVIRSRGSNFYITGGFDHKKLDDRIDSLGTSTSKKVDALRLTGSGDSIDGALGGGANNYSLTFSSGDLKISPDAARTLDAAGRRTNGGFQKFAYDVSRSQRLTDRASLYLAISGQFASKNLDSSEKMSLGGPQGVRAYPVGEAAADIATLMQVELRYRTGTMAGMDSNLAAFVDNGMAQVNETTIAGDVTNRRNLLGYGLGLTLAKPGSLFARAMVAWRGERERPTSDNDRSPRAWVQMGAYF